MPKVDPDNPGRMLSDDPDQADEELAGGKVEGDYPKDHSDTGHHSPVAASPGGDDEGPRAPSETQSNDPSQQQGTGHG
jgi:hypothetical protein